MRFNRSSFLILLPVLLFFGLVLAVFGAQSAQSTASGALLSGIVKSDSGEKMAGVTVSAKSDGKTITTSVFTDEDGAYYFPPLSPGKYRVWAQTYSFETGRGDVELGAAARQDFVLKPMKDFERQLTGDQILASLPDATPEDRRLKHLFRNNCTGCHQPNYILQNRFDEQGWTSIMNLMRQITIMGAFQGEDSAPDPHIQYHQKELAAYLARVRGPGPSIMKFKLRARPTGDTARAVFTEYDVPLDPEVGYETKYLTNDGSDWSIGTPSTLNGGHGVHDAQMDLSGNIWFTYNVTSPNITYGKLDVRTGEIKTFRIPGKGGNAAASHGMTRDQQGIIWADLRGSATAKGTGGALTRIDPATDNIEVFTTPSNMAGPSSTMDIDGKGFVWASTARGAIRFDPNIHEFKEFLSLTQADENGAGTTYGIAADRDGNAWWGQMGLDIVGRSDIETGKSFEIREAPLKEYLGVGSPEDRKMDSLTGSDFHTAVPWAQGPRRLGADKSADVVWVCNSYGGNLLRIDTRTMKTTFVPMPSPDDVPYHATVDSNHNVWVNMMDDDRIMRYDPKTSVWTAFPLPTLGAEVRYVSLLERNGSTQVVIPYSRARKVARMTIRTKEDMQALKKQVGHQDGTQARM